MSKRICDHHNMMEYAECRKTNFLVRETTTALELPHSGNTFKWGGIAMSGIGGFTSTGVILVLFILLVIISRGFLY
ncbi:hypothetical protein GCM10020370_06440 [Paenibacillus hodogayensis]